MSSAALGVSSIPVGMTYTTVFPSRKQDPRYITWGLIWDPFYKEPKGRIDISEMYTTWIVHRMN